MRRWVIFCFVVTLALCIVKFVSNAYAETLFSDNFNEGALLKWDAKETAYAWKVEREDGNFYLKGTGLAMAGAGSPIWTDYTLQFKARIIAGEFEVGFRLSKLGRYYIGYDDVRKEIYLGKSKPWGVNTRIKVAAMPLESNKWYTFTVVVENDALKVSVNNVTKIEYSDSDPHLSGGIQLISLDNSEINFDNITVERIIR